MFSTAGNINLVCDVTANSTQLCVTSLIIQIPRFDRTVQTQKMSMEWPVGSDYLVIDRGTLLTYAGGRHIRGGRLFRSGAILELDHIGTSLGYSLKCQLQRLCTYTRLHLRITLDISGRWSRSILEMERSDSRKG